jgi:GNAT superfamily N-acetyltransferase
MKALVAAGRVPGLLAYHHGAPVGWCSVAPREEYPRLQRSRVTAPVDDQRVWAVVCFFVVRKFRRSGVALGLLKAAVDFVRERGGDIVEGYPTEPATGRTADVFAYHGTASLFRRAGFTEVARRSPTRPVMRYVISGKPQGDMVAGAAAEMPREPDQAGGPWRR